LEGLGMRKIPDFYLSQTLWFGPHSVHLNSGILQIWNKRKPRKSSFEICVFSLFLASNIWFKMSAKDIKDPEENVEEEEEEEQDFDGGLCFSVFFLYFISVFTHFNSS
jgi:hypothetical protein